MNHEFFMSEALRIAEQGRGKVAPNPMVGAVLVKNNEIIATGFHQEYGQPHAEVNCLKNLNSPLTGDEIMYVTLEPCSHHGKQPPCADFLINSGIKSVVVAMKDPNPLVAGNGIAKLLDAGITVESGVCEKEALQLNRGFAKRITEGRPWITLKVAMTMQGHLAPIPLERVQLTTEESRVKVYNLRAEHDAILVGRNTLLIDNPYLGATAGKYQPLRVVWGRSAESSLSVDLDWYRDENRRYCQAVTVTELLSQLEDVNSVFVEGGAQVLKAFANFGLVDELYVLIPQQHAGFNKGLLAFDKNMDWLSKLKLQELEQVGTDLWLRFISHITQ